eukprot:SAG11_NODE_50540_length_113_cov_91.214286_1_plen_29_part_10
MTDTRALTLKERVVSFKGIVFENFRALGS